MRTYEELIQLSTFEERFNYLRLNGIVANETFGFDRYLNQRFYRSPEWKRVREYVIFRDHGCDMGLPGHEIYDQIIVHHMNPISLDEIENNPEILLDPNYLICVSLKTHNEIHYGVENCSDPNRLIERKPGDTKLWR